MCELFPMLHLKQGEIVGGMRRNAMPGVRNVGRDRHRKPLVRARRTWARRVPSAAGSNLDDRIYSMLCFYWPLPYGILHV